MPSAFPGLKEGMKVVINPVVSCGACYYCKSGKEYLCENLGVIGGELEGAMKEEIAVPLENIVPLPDSFDLAYSSLIEPATVAVHSVSGLVRNGVRKSTVLVIGLGTIGLLIQQVCALYGNTVIAMDVQDHSLEISKKLGADLTVNAKKEDPVKKISAYLGEKKLDVVFDDVNTKVTLNMAVGILKKQGEIIMVGIPPKNFEVNVIDILCKEIHVMGSYLYTDQEFRTAAGLVTGGKLNVKLLLSKSFPFERAAEAYEYKLTVPSIKVALSNDK
jgi:2-desacetyl-2-hydroxyethyl bacteriochlorophyllide A dehydrogenase